MKMNKIEEEKNNSFEMIDIHSKKSKDTYKQKILVKIQKSNFSVNSSNGFNVLALEKIKFYLKKHHMFYELMLKEKALEYSLTTNKIMISLISKKGYLS